MPPLPLPLSQRAEASCGDGSQAATLSTPPGSGGSGGSGEEPQQPSTPPATPQRNRLFWVRGNRSKLPRRSKQQLRRSKQKPRRPRLAPAAPAPTASRHQIVMAVLRATAIFGTQVHACSDRRAICASCLPVDMSLSPSFTDEMVGRCMEVRGR